MRKYYDNIQLARVVACLSVWLVHLGQYFSLNGRIRVITDFGQYGPYMFFIISGFLAVATTIDKFDLKTYYKSRIIRILVLYYIVLLIHFLLHTFLWEDVPFNPVAKTGWTRYIFFYYQIFLTGVTFWDNLGALWSVNVFVFFYIVFPIIRKYINSFQKAFLFQIACFFIPRILGKLVISLYPAVSFELFRDLYYFSLGITLFYAIKEKRDPILQRICVLGVFLMGIVWGEMTTHVWALLFVLLLSLTINMSLKNKRIKQYMNKLDEYTYGIYLVHPILLDVVPKIVSGSDKYHKSIELLLIVVGTIITTYIIHNFLEKPIQKMINIIWG